MARLTSAEIILQERLRVSQMLESPEGAARPSLARELALRSPMDADSAIALLAKSPAEENPFVAAMNKEQMGLSSLGSSMSSKDKRLAELSQVATSYNKARGYKA